MTILEPGGDSRRNPFDWLVPPISQKPSMQNEWHSFVYYSAFHLPFGLQQALTLPWPAPTLICPWPAQLPLSIMGLSPLEGGRTGTIQGQAPTCEMPYPHLRAQLLPGPFPFQAYTPPSSHLFGSAGSSIRINRRTPEQRAQTSVQCQALSGKQAAGNDRLEDPEPQDSPDHSAGAGHLVRGTGSSGNFPTPSFSPIA